AVTGRTRREAGEVGARPGFAEQLAPRDRAVVDRRDQALDLLLGAVAEDGGRGHEQAHAAGWLHRAVALERGADGDDRAPGVAEPAPLTWEVRGRPARPPDEVPPLRDREVGIPVLVEPLRHRGEQIGVVDGRRDRVGHVDAPAGGSPPRAFSRITIRTSSSENAWSSLTKSSGWASASPCGQSEPKSTCPVPTRSASLRRSSS